MPPKSSEPSSSAIVADEASTTISAPLPVQDERARGSRRAGHAVDPPALTSPRRASMRDVGNVRFQLSRSPSSQSQSPRRSS
jgi:hypothetical protein